MGETVRQPIVRQPMQYKLKPTPDQARQLEAILWRCRVLYPIALEQRKPWWLRGQEKAATYCQRYQQKAEVADLKAAFPELAAVNAQVLQDVLLRLDRAFQAFFRRMKNGETPGYPRFQGVQRYHSFTYTQVGEHGGARLDTGWILAISS
jgi:putative transposase